MEIYATPIFRLTPLWIVKQLCQHRRDLLLWLAGFTIVGVVYALLSPVEFTTEVRLLPELQARSALNLKKFGALAELAGINLESTGTTEAIRPDLYPDVLTSTPFALFILNQPVTTSRKIHYRTLATFLTDPSRSWLGGLLGNESLTVPGAGRANQSLRLTRDQEELIKSFKKRIVSDLDKQSGIIGIRVKMPDADVAAQVGQLAIRYLTRYVVNYRTEKTREDLKFLADRHREARQRYQKALLTLAAYKDQHRYLVNQVATLDGRQLEAEFMLAQSLYDNLTHQYEQTRIRVQEETPVLNVLEPPQVPPLRSEPRRTLLVCIFALVGLLAGSAWVLARSLNWMQLLNE